MMRLLGRGQWRRTAPFPHGVPSSGRHLAWAETHSSPAKLGLQLGKRRCRTVEKPRCVQRQEEHISNISPLALAGERGGGVSHWWQIWMGKPRRWSSGCGIGWIFKEVKVEGEQAIHAYRRRRGRHGHRCRGGRGR